MNIAKILTLEIFMTLVILTALGVGLATFFGGILGFAFGKSVQRHEGAMMAFSSGVMLACSFTSLIIPAFRSEAEPLIVAICILLGGLFIFLFDRLIGRLDVGFDDEGRHTLLFVFAMALHNLPEGIASGVGFGLGDMGEAISIALSVAVQNIPEGMVIIAPLMSLGISKKKTLLISLMTGGVEVVGTLLGYFFISEFASLLPIALSLAGGTMVYVIYAESRSGTEEGHGADSMIFLLGAALMLLFCFTV